MSDQEQYGAVVEGFDRQLLDIVRKFVEKEVWPVRKKLDDDKDRTIASGLTQKLCDVGLLRAFLPEEAGGLDMQRKTTWCMCAEELSRGDVGIATELFISNAWMWIPAIRAKNMAILKELASLYTGDEFHTACFAMTEPAGGANIESALNQGRTVKTTAKLDGDEWVINGMKCWPSGAGHSDVYATVCTTDPKLGTDGLAIIYHPGNLPGLTFGKPERKMGMIYTDVNADIYYDNVRVPRKWRASGPGEDWKHLVAIKSWGRLLSGAACTGVAQAVFEIVKEYTGNRYYGGRRVREHSLQASILADMVIGIESARAYYLQVAKMGDTPEVYGDMGDHFMLGKASGVRAYAADMVNWVCGKAIELMGSYGYSKEFLVERYLRDVKILQLWIGGPQLDRLDIAQAYYDIPVYEKVEPIK